MTESNAAGATGADSDAAEGATGDGPRSATGDETIPGPDGLPFLGETLSFLRADVEYGTELQQYGDIVAFDALGLQFVGVYDPAIVQTVLVERNEEFCKGEFGTALGEAFAPAGLAFSEGEEWRRDRMLLQPAFTPRHIRSFAGTMADRTAAAADDWGDGEVVNLREECSRLTLDVLTRTLFDLDLAGERGQVVRRAADAISDRTSGVSMVVPEWIPTPTNRRLERSTDALDELLDELVTERRSAGGDRDDLLSALLAAEYPDGSTMDDERIRDQLFTFLFAGHETTAVALTYALWLLAGDESARAAVDAELDRVCGDDDPTFAALADLELTDAVVRETLRLYPPAYVLYREPVEDTTLGGYAVPSDATIVLAAYQIHRDERWWDAPDEFRPDRWLTDYEGDNAGDGGVDASADRPEYAYFPFGGGPRHCIGMRFATMELKLALATLLRRTRFERVTETLSPDAKVTLDPGEVLVRVQKE